MYPDDKAANIIVRTDLKPGDVDGIVNLHGRLYSQECGFDQTFETYVSGPLTDFARSSSPRGRIWIAERDGCMVGCVAIVPLYPDAAQLRWFLVDPDFRGAGLGKNLLCGAVAFCREHGYASIILWTVSCLAAAAHLYRKIGFRKVEERPGVMWGMNVVEEKYQMILFQVQ